jgi:2'-5' RNA ligase
VREPAVGVRLFVALELPGPQRDRLAGYLAGCEAVAGHYRWVPAANLHLTLRFIGSVPPATLDALRTALDEVSLRPFRMRLGGLGTFGSKALRRVVWIGLEEGGEAASGLAAAVETACVRSGLAAAADLAFRPHLTLARSGKPGGPLPRLPEPPELAPWEVTGFTLYRSRLGRPHPAYSPLARYGAGPRSTPGGGPENSGGERGGASPGYPG